MYAGSNQLQAGDVIHSIDGIRLFGKSLQDVRELVHANDDKN